MKPKPEPKPKRGRPITRKVEVHATAEEIAKAVKSANKARKKPKVEVQNQRYEGATPEMVAKALFRQKGKIGE